MRGALWHAAALALAGAALWNGGAAAQSAANAANASLLYQDALQSIAEGRKNDASETLMRVVENEPLHAGAWLDLALIQCGLGHPDEAKRLFDAIEARFDPPPGIRERIAQARAEGCGQREASARYNVRLARGIDQNVNQGASNLNFQVGPATARIDLALLPDFLPKHDQYTLLSTDYAREIGNDGAQGFLQLQARRNDRLSQYDSASLFAGAEKPWRFGRWTAHGAALLGVITLGGEPYQRLLQLQAQAGPPLPLPGQLQLTVSGSLTHVDYLTLTNFNSNTMELRGQLDWRTEHAQASASLAYLEDRAGAARPGGDRSGPSLVLQWRGRLSENLNGELGYVRQDWHSQAAYAPGLIDLRRAQRAEAWRAGLSYPLSKNQSLLLELREVRNKENISIFQYNSRQLQLSWQWQNP